MAQSDSLSARPPLGPLALLAQKQAETARARALAEVFGPPAGNTGGTSRQAHDIKRENDSPRVEGESDSAAKCPPLSGRSSRARRTSSEMDRWLRSSWFFDWLSVTIPNGKNGKGAKRRASPADLAKAGRFPSDERGEVLALLHEENRQGEAEADEAQDRLCLWAVSQGLRQQRVARGADGYDGALHYALDPTEGERLATVRAGHKTNMPNLELPGGDGACARLAPLALDLLGPVLLARADVSCDYSQLGLFDDLLSYARRVSKAHGMAAPRYLESDTGRTFYWGKGEVSVKVYQKDLERVAKGKIDPFEADADLVRVEFRFAPQSDRKAGMAIIAKRGPWGLLSTSHWVRGMVEYMGEVTGMTQKGATLAVQRVPKTPDPRSCADRSGHGIAQYAATHCAAVVSQIVRERFKGDWLAADVQPEAVRRGVLDMIAGYLDSTGLHEAAVSRLGVDAVRDIEEEAKRGSQALTAWMDRQREATECAQERLLGAAHVAALKASQGPDGPVSSSNTGSSGVSSGVMSGTSTA